MAGLCSKDVKQASRLLLRTLYLLMQDLGPLPNDITLSMKLLYYNDGKWGAVSALGKNSIFSVINVSPVNKIEHRKGEMGEALG